MQFLITAYDGKDEKASERRLAAREQHLKTVTRMKEEGRHLFAAAILDENEKMIGSVLIVDFPSKDELHEYLEKEPYVVEKVWEEIDVKPVKVGPMFAQTKA